jgi:hypothetical protein
MVYTHAPIFIRLNIAKTVLLLVLAAGSCMPHIYAQGTETSPDYGLLNYSGKTKAKVFITTGKTLNAAKITSASFRSNFTDIPEKYYTSAKERYWFLIDLAEVDLSVAEKWYVSFNYFDDIVMYYISGDTLQSRKAGILQKERNIGVRDITDIPFTKDELIEDRYLYAQVRHISRKTILSTPFYKNDFTIDFFDNYFSRGYLLRQVPYYIFLGGMLLMFFYFIGFYFMYRDSLFIHYSVYLLVLILYIGSRTHLIQELFRNSMPVAAYIFNDVIQVLVNVFYLKFSQNFLNAKIDFPKLDKAIRYAITFLITVVLFQLTILIINPFSSAEYYIINAQRYFMIVFSLASYIYILRNYKKKVVLFLIAGSFFYLSGAVLAMFFWELKFLMAGTAVEIFVFSLGIGYRVKKVEQEKKSIEAEITQVKLTALQAQMNPHFIFNSLNSIRAYVISNETKKASDYLNKFARLIRLILHYSSKDTISLKEELEALTLYIELEQMRFRDDFGFELKIAPGIYTEKLFLPPLILQPYVENAIGHGLAPKSGSKKLLVEISKSEGNLTFSIQDNGVGRNYSKATRALKNPEHKSVAMALTRKRIDLLSNNPNENENISIVDLMDGDQPSGTLVKIKLPIQEKLRHET